MQRDAGCCGRRVRAAVDANDATVLEMPSRPSAHGSWWCADTAWSLLHAAVWAAALELLMLGSGCS